MGLRDPVRRRVRPDPALERHFLSVGRRPEEAQLVLLAARSGLSVRQTQRWFRRRRNLERPPPSRKFCEACWRFLFYLSSFLAGLSVLYHVSTRREHGEDGGGRGRMGSWGRTGS
ncbi:ceramide synthase 4-like [Psammomys obesus]|uniref:ceramide synthase 4-like n=1 Tax=Psammomys obesus TaxID=48139 RepID=UPI00245344DC|nr:ceramide synthase 4-like [Psammomys obesus]